MAVEHDVSASSKLSFDQYADEDKPLASYATMSGVFVTGLAASLFALSRRGQLPDRVSAGDLVLVGVATHKLSRLVTKDKVTSFLRAPFTKYEKAAGKGEVEERARGSGTQRALGELLSCPYCLAQWLAAGFMAGLVTAPRQTRFVASIYVAETISDFLQAAYRAADKA